MNCQITNSILMIRPIQFRMNEQTAVNNYYQKVLGNLRPSAINIKAVQEFDTFVDKLYTCNLIDLKIIEDFSEFEDEALGEEIDLEDTMTLLKEYVDVVETDLDKQRIKNLLQSLYIEAQDTV